MSNTLDLQPWTTIEGDAGQAGVVQDIDRWINTGAYKVGVLQVEMPQVSGCTLVVEGCDVFGGAFTTHASFTQSATGACILYLNKNVQYGVAARLSQIVRWKLQAGAGAWDATFRITLVLK